MSRKNEDTVVPPTTPSKTVVSGQRQDDSTLVTLFLSSMIAGGVQFGWALQLSLLTPYIQTLGIEHEFSSIIWLCGPITGLMVQPFVGMWSDRCKSKLGRRRPFILVGCFMIATAITLIGFAADLGTYLGDTKESCTYKYGAAVFLIIGFWILDVANNTVQGPARALLADLSGPSQCHLANGVFCSWMAIGNILGYSAGSFGDWYRWFPSLLTNACCKDCVNLKAAFIAAVIFLLFCLSITMVFANEIPLTDGPMIRSSQSEVGNSSSSSEADGKALETEGSKKADDFGLGQALGNIFGSLQTLPPGMSPVLTVTGITWIAWFPFFLFDTDWMGREIYHGDPTKTGDAFESYQTGVRQGTFGLLLNSVVLFVCSFFINPMCKTLGAKIVWAFSNFLLFLCFSAMTALSLLSAKETVANDKYKSLALLIFSAVGIPLSVLFSVPFSVTHDLTADSGGGQGLATGVLNLAIVIPQMIVSIFVGPWDAIFGGGNVPAFALAGVIAFLSGILALLKVSVIANSHNAAFHGFG